MAISNHSVISKMQRELQILQDKTPSKTELRQHIGNVKLMCELLLENETDELSGLQTRPALNEDVMKQKPQQSPAEMTEEEYNVMIKGKAGLGTNRSKHTVKKPETNNSLTHHDEANGDSIFDF